jgi:hypothetical protein
MLLRQNGPFSSTGSPITFSILPSTSLPTGIWIGSAVLTTSMPRTSPSVVSMAIVRTVFSPTCCATSEQDSGSVVDGRIVRRRAVYISGSSFSSNLTSTTGPITCTTLPFCAFSVTVAIDSPSYFIASTPVTISISSLVMRPVEHGYIYRSES